METLERTKRAASKTEVPIATKLQILEDIDANVSGTVWNLSFNSDCQLRDFSKKRSIPGKIKMSFLEVYVLLGGAIDG